MKKLCVGLVIVVLAAAAIAQEEPRLLRKMIEEERSAVDAVLLYSEEVRNAIFEASVHPEALVRMQGMQQVSREAFESLVMELPENCRKMLWELARYPALVTALTAAGQRPSNDETTSLVNEYHEEIHEAAHYIVREEFDALVRLQRMNRDTESVFERLLESYSPATREALRKLVDLPEVLEILTDNMTMVVLVGDAYKKNPERVMERAAEMALGVARRDAEAQEAWSKRLQENPEAVAELERSSKEYAAEIGLETAPKTSLDVTVTYNPYPYWYGYPYWYASPYWYPYPYWYHAGFYYGPGGAIIIVGTPSYRYAHWHVRGHHHHYRYPHLSDSMVHHWQHHRDADGLSDAVGGWVQANQDRMPKDWLRDDGKRAERLAEHGRFEEAFERHNRENPGIQISREQFLVQRSRDLPAVSGTRSDRQGEGGVRDGSRNPAERTRPSGEVRRERATGRHRQRMASDRHRGSWERSRLARGGRRGGRGG